MAAMSGLSFTADLVHHSNSIARGRIAFIFNKMVLHGSAKAAES